jgi:hypothetical protein
VLHEYITRGMEAMAQVRGENQAGAAVFLYANLILEDMPEFGKYDFVTKALNFDASVVHFQPLVGRPLVSKELREDTIEFIKQT